MDYEPIISDDFVRVGRDRFVPTEISQLSQETVVAEIVPPNRKKSDRRRQHRAQPTRRACNVR